VIVILFVPFLSLVDNAGANGKKHDPLPDTSNGCNESSQDKNPHCNPAPEVKVTPESTKVKVQPTPVATKVESKPTEVKVTPEPTATPEVTATSVVTVTSKVECSDEVCNPCEFLTDALNDGMMVIILDKDKVTVYEDFSISIDGQFDVLATGLLSESAYD
jgi:hypothetical protein